MFDIDRVFTYHAPFGDQKNRYFLLREKAQDFARVIEEYCPESAERTTALRKLQECVMFANASIAINEVE